MTEGPEVLLREAGRLRRENRVPEAIAAYESVLARWPRLADAWYNLALLQRQSRRLTEALSSYQRALDAGISRPEEVYLNRSVIFSDYLRDPAAAMRELQEALIRNPAYTPAVLNLANLYEDVGRRAEAATLYERILASDPAAFEALARYANLQPPAGDHAALIERLRTALTAAGSAADRASLGFALGRLLDASARYPEAFAAYARANRDSAASAGPHVVRYDRRRQEHFVDELIRGGTPRETARAAGGAPQPIFICGMFRSGSTLVEQLLGSFAGVAAGGEIDFLPVYVNSQLMPFFESMAALSCAELDATAARYRAELRRVSADAAFVTDKRPDNFLYIGLIKSLFPDAKIVHTVRDPLDNCLSVFFLHLEQQLSYALDLMDTGHYFREYRRLMTHWKSTFGGDIFDLDYDALVRAPEQTLEGLCAFLGLEWTGRVPTVAARSAAIRTASVWQVREPLYQTSSGRARHYETELAALREFLAGAS